MESFSSNTVGNCRGYDIHDTYTKDEYNEKVCEHCRCFEGTYTTESLPEAHHAGCHEVVCDLETRTLNITVGSVNVTCPFEGG